MSWTSLCELSDLEPGRGKYVEIDGFKLAVFLEQEQVYVTDDRCPHAGASLSGGHVAAGCAVCPYHGWAFRLENGQLEGAPGVTISTYRTRLHPHAGKILVQARLPIY